MERTIKHILWQQAVTRAALSNGSNEIAFNNINEELLDTVIYYSFRKKERHEGGLIGLDAYH